VQNLVDFRHQSALTHSGFEMEQHIGNIELPVGTRKIELRSYAHTLLTLP